MEAKDHQKIYSMMGMPSMYKTDKMNYSRQDIHLISAKIRSKLVENERILATERKRNAELKG
jgi:hypothetical protein